MRAPHFRTLSCALALAESSTERGQQVSFSVPQIRALIYETTAQQGMVHFRDADARSHAVSATEVWEVAGYDDVLRTFGCWCGRPEGLVFAVSIVRPNGAWHIDIRSCSLPGRPG